MTNKKQKIVYQSWDKTITGISTCESYEVAEQVILKNIADNKNKAHNCKDGISSANEFIMFMEMDQDNRGIGFHVAIKGDEI